MFVTATYDKWESYLRAECGHAERTVHGYLADLRIIGAWMFEHVGKTIEAATYEDMTAWIRASTLEGHKGSTISRRISALKDWLKFIGRELLANRLTRPKRVHPLRCIPNITEMRRLLESTTGRDRAILEVLYGTGVRNAELCALNVQDVAGAEVRVIGGKGGKDRAVPLNPAARAALDEYLKTRPGALPADPLFLRDSGKRFNTAACWRLIEQAGRLSHQRVPLFPHLLRHAFASHLAQAGVNLRYIQDWMGHSDIKATAIYLHYDITQTRAMVLRCLPRERLARGLSADVPVSEIIRQPFAVR